MAGEQVRLLLESGRSSVPIRHPPRSQPVEDTNDLGRPPGLTTKDRGVPNAPVGDRDFSARASSARARGSVASRQHAVGTEQGAASSRMRFRHGGGRLRFKYGGEKLTVTATPACAPSAQVRAFISAREPAVRFESQRSGSLNKAASESSEYAMKYDACATSR